MPLLPPLLTPLLPPPLPPNPGVAPAPGSLSAGERAGDPVDQVRYSALSEPDAGIVRDAPIAEPSREPGPECEPSCRYPGRVVSAAVGDGDVQHDVALAFLSETDAYAGSTVTATVSDTIFGICNGAALTFRRRSCSVARQLPFADRVQTGAGARLLCSFSSIDRSEPNALPYSEDLLSSDTAFAGGPVTVSLRKG